MEKQDLTQQKHTFNNQKKCTTTQNKHTKTKAGLVNSYDNRPGIGEGLFWFRRFINLSLTYLLKHLPTYLQPHGEKAKQSTDRQQVPNITGSVVTWSDLLIMILLQIYCRVRQRKNFENR